MDKVGRNEAIGDKLRIEQYFRNRDGWRVDVVVSDDCEVAARRQMDRQTVKEGDSQDVT